MSKTSSTKVIFYFLAAMFAIAFPAILVRDYALLYEYGSAPFYVYVGTRALELLVPAAICYLIGRKIK